MIRQIALFSFLSFAMFAKANGLNEGNNLLKTKKIKEAILKFEDYVDKSEDISAYYNLGIAYHMNNEHGKAIWAFEKVLKFDPNDQDAFDQIIACQHDIDPTNNWSPILGTLESNLYSYSSDFWACTSIFLALLLTFILVKLSFIKGNHNLWLVALGIFLLTLFTVYVANEANSFITNEYGIAVIETTVLENHKAKYAPSQKLILEGTRVTILEEVDGNYLKVLNDEGEELYVYRSTIKTF